MNIKEEVLKKTDSGLDIFKFYLPFDFQVKKNFKNPLYDDHNASCNIFYSQRHRLYLMKDFGNDDYSGDCFKFAGAVMGLDVRRDFRQVLSNIIKDLNLPLQPPTQIVRYTPAFLIKDSISSRKQKQSADKPKPYEFKAQPWSPSSLSYWSKYGISENTLKKYNVMPISQFKSVGKNGDYVIKATPTAPMFGYFGDSWLKLYRPNSEVRFQYAGRKPDNYCFGLQQLPRQGDVVFIVGGEKDVLSLASRGFSAVCFNSETSCLPESVLEQLKNRFDHLVIMYDCDDTGMQAMEKAVMNHSDVNLLSLTLPLEGTKKSKDISDYFSSGYEKSDFQNLVSELLNPMDSETGELLASCTIDFKNLPPETEPIISAGGVTLGTADNLMCVTGSSGSGKSQFVASIVAGALVTWENTEIDTLGLSIAPNCNKRAVIHFDTEQSFSQFSKTCLKILKRSALEAEPPYYHPISIGHLSLKEALQCVKRSFGIYGRLHGGVHLMVIDGIADLVMSPNDEKECKMLVKEIFDLAERYHTLVICVIHLVPNGYKLRGHLGSELQRKVISILCIEKEENRNVSVIKTFKVRDGNPFDVPILMFTWDENCMPVFCGQKSEEDKNEHKVKELTEAFRSVLSSVPAQPYKNLWEGISRLMGVTDHTAKEYVSFMYHKGLLKKRGNNYSLAPKINH